MSRRESVPAWGPCLPFPPIQRDFAPAAAPTCSTTALPRAKASGRTRLAPEYRLVSPLFNPSPLTVGRLRKPGLRRTCKVELQRSPWLAKHRSSAAGILGWTNKTRQRRQLLYRRQGPWRHRVPGPPWVSSVSNGLLGAGHGVWLIGSKADPGSGGADDLAKRAGFGASQWHVRNLRTPIRTRIAYFRRGHVPIS